jgi:hypothetical protein
LDPGSVALRLGVRDQHAGELSERLFGSVAKEPRGCRIPAADEAGRIECHECVVGGIGKLFEDGNLGQTQRR